MYKKTHIESNTDITAGKILEVVEDTDLVITIDQGNQK